MNRLILISPDRDSGFKPILFGPKTSVIIGEHLILVKSIFSLSAVLARVLYKARERGQHYKCKTEMLPTIEEKKIKGIVCLLCKTNNSLFLLASAL
jgi:hypothetical protein